MFCAIPIETIVRELDGALYQALHLAARGLPTLLGGRMVDEIVEMAEGPVIYFNNDHFSSLSKRIIENGGTVLNVHPEGINLVDSEHVAGLFAKSASEASFLCLWGDGQAELIRGVLSEEMGAKIRVTGHPAFDLVNKRFVSYYRRPEIAARYGEDYILINTNFGYINHMMGLEKYIRMVRESIEIFNDEGHLRSVRILAAYQESLLHPFMEAAKALARDNVDRFVILRPHPVESEKLYRDAFREFPNIVVSKKGSVREWIATCGAVVHHDCTTGIESLFMGKPTIHFRPVFDAGIAAHIASLAGEHAVTVEDVVEIVRNGSISDESAEAQLDSLKPYFANLTSEAARTLTDLAVVHSIDSASWRPRPLGLGQEVKCWRKYLSKRMRVLQPGHNGRKVRHSLIKFSRLPMDVVADRIEALRRTVPSLPKVRLVRICLDTFLVEPDEAAG